MTHLGDLTRGAQVKGILPDGLVTVVDVQWHGAVAIELTYKDAAGRLGNEIQAEIPDGASEQLVRTVTENCRTMRFRSYSFEERRSRADFPISSLETP